ncbi:hypothetical protein J437_LFUL008362 [Ladona fulva]|uniref:Uncharacterized protein n=1 Tax=Ladona fulva TaxID=123851 RepID=A0A8K0P4E5_LADFU|nr:hypothetical protein J437_LFUL008362 [Ladona fulva]
MLTRCVCLLHDNAGTNTAPLPRDLLTIFWMGYCHPSRLRGKNGGIENLLREAEHEVFDTGIKNLVPRLQKCIDLIGSLLVEFMLQGETFYFAPYCETIKKLRKNIKNRRRGMLTRCVCLLHDNAGTNTAPLPRDLLTIFWMGYCHPSRLRGKNGGIENLLREAEHEVFDTGIKNLVPRLQKCIDLIGEYVEK